MNVALEKGKYIEVMIYRGSSQLIADTTYSGLLKMKNNNTPVKLENTEFKLLIEDVTRRKVTEPYDGALKHYQVILKGELI